jgi:starvation-inducible DNA-binding protein
MYKTSVSIPEKDRAVLVALLNAGVALSIDLGLQAKQAHWNVKGPHFIALHELFDKVVDMAHEHSDSLAERAMQLGGLAQGTLQQVAKASSLPAYPAELVDGLGSVSVLAASLAAYANLSRKAIDESAKLGDQATADLFTEGVRDADKMLWFLEAHLQA